MAGQWQADLGEWPIAVVYLAGASAGAPSFESFEASIDEGLERDEPCAMVLDLSGAAPDAQRRRMVVDALKARRERVERNVRVGALVLPSGLQRGIITAVRWLNPRPLRIPWESFPTRDAALRFARARFEELRGD